MDSPKLIAIFGATGMQGGSVVQSLLHNEAKTFSVRGITRNPDSAQARALAAQGVDIVRADGLDRESLVRAFQGVWGVFANTNSDDPSVTRKGGLTELDVGRNIVDAAAEAGVQHFVFSGMASASKTTRGAIPEPAFDRKHAIGEYAVNKGAFRTVNIVSPGWYLENQLVKDLAPLLGGFPFIPDSGGILTLEVPRWGGNEEIPFIAVEDDYGDIVHGVFLDPERFNGKLVQAISQSASLEQLVQAFAKVTGKKAQFVPVEPWTSWDIHGIQALETIKTMFGFCQFSGGLYYGVPNNTVAAKELKKTAVEAQGGSNVDGNLSNVVSFMSKHFGRELASVDLPGSG